MKVCCLFNCLLERGGGDGRASTGGDIGFISACTYKQARTSIGQSGSKLRIDTISYAPPNRGSAASISHHTLSPSLISLISLTSPSHHSPPPPPLDMFIFVSPATRQN